MLVEKELEKMVESKLTPKSLILIVQLVIGSFLLFFTISTVNLIIYNIKQNGALSDMDILSSKLNRMQLSARLLDVM